LSLRKRVQAESILFKALSAAVYGIDAYLVEVEVDVSAGLGNFLTVGLPDMAVKESKERIKAAIKNCGLDYPFQNITVNLAPADIKKEGSGFDLPMAIGILGTNGTLLKKDLNDYLFLGELSLDGSLRPIKGALSIAVAAQQKGIRKPGAAAGQRPRSGRGEGHLGLRVEDPAAGARSGEPD